MIRQFFHALSVRERFLIALFIWGLLLVWLLGALESFATVWNRFQDNRDTLNLFAERLEEEETAEAMLERARSGLDSAKTFSAAQLVGRLDSIARETELNSFDISTPSTVDTDLFTFNNVRLNVKRAQISELIAFDQEIKEYSPYIALSEFQLRSNRRDPRYLDAVFELVSFQLKEDALDD